MCSLCAGNHRHHLTNREQLAVYLSAILSLLIATVLGLLDDLFDIRWRHKLPIPLFASVPLLLVYYAEQGNTHVVFPKPLRQLFGTFVNLGPSRIAFSITSNLTPVPRTIILHIYGTPLNFYHQRHQYLRRNKRGGGCTDNCHFAFDHYQ